MNWWFVICRAANRLETQAEVDTAVLRQNLFYLRETSVFTLEAFNWLYKAHHMCKGNHTIEQMD